MSESHPLTISQSNHLEALSTQSTQATKVYISNSSSRTTRLKALSAAKKLVRELQTGDDAWFTLTDGAISAQVIRWLLHLKVHEHTPLTGSITLSELASKINAEPGFLVRFMRPACAAGFFAEIEPGVFAHNKASLAFLEGGSEAFFEILTEDMAHKTMARYPEYYSTRPLAEPEDPKYNPYAWANDMDGSMWFEVLGKNPAMFNRFLAGMKSKWGTFPATGIYPFDTELAGLSKQAVDEEGVFMVDVGAAQGFTMKEIRDAYPQLGGKVVVQDIPRVIATIKPGDLPDSIEPMVHDFWTPQPVKEAKVYFFRRIMHDWPDKQCEIILRHTAEAMTQESRILCMELLIPERVQMDEPFCYWADLMMMMFAGRERTEADWRRLFDASGLELVKIWLPEVGQQAVIEGRKKKQWK